MIKDNLNKLFLKFVVSCKTANILPCAESSTNDVEQQNLRIIIWFSTWKIRRLFYLLITIRTLGTMCFNKYKWKESILVSQLIIRLLYPIKNIKGALIGGQSTHIKQAQNLWSNQRMMTHKYLDRFQTWNFSCAEFNANVNEVHDAPSDCHKPRFSNSTSLISFTYALLSPHLTRKCNPQSCM